MAQIVKSSLQPSRFVVLTKITTGVRGTRYHIHNPALGVTILRQEYLSRHFTGVALELLKSDNFKPRVERKQLGITQLWSSMAGFWQTIRQVLLLSIVLQFFILVSSFFLQISIDTVFPSFDKDLLFVLAIGFGGLTIINFAATCLRSLVLVTLSNSLSYQVIVNLFRHLVRLPLDWFEKRHIGDILSRFGSTQPISRLLSEGMIAALIDGVMAILTLVLIFVYSAVLCSLAVCALILYTLVRLAFLHALRLRNLDVIATAARESSNFIETVRGIAAIKALGQEGNRQRLWQRVKVDAINAQINLGRLTACFDAVGQLIMALEKVLFVYIAIHLALKAELTLGMIFAFQAYEDQFLGAGMRLVEHAINFKIIQMHLSRISDIALSKAEDDGRSLADGAPDYGQRLELRGVRYRYGVGENDVLKNVNLKIEAGEMVALIGPSGGGKTTLMKIMMGFFEPSYGELFVGDQPLASFDKRKARQAVGSIAQDDNLFAGSLAENIAFFDPQIDMLRVREAAATACILDDIMRMPMQFDTMVGDMGSALSGGQKQRVMLARALYHRPRILFIDEGTAHLDIITEEKVLDNLKMLDATIVVVAHRSKSIESADRVIVVDAGYAVERPIRVSVEK